jgi:hypothetical protein
LRGAYKFLPNIILRHVYEFSELRQNLLSVKTKRGKKESKENKTLGWIG